MLMYIGNSSIAGGDSYVDTTCYFDTFHTLSLCQ